MKAQSQGSYMILGPHGALVPGLIRLIRKIRG
jgi:hypothetical protein